LFEVQVILDRKQNGQKLTPLEVHDIVCHIADAVLAGGIRRAALIALFSADDEEMTNCKSGRWWELNPQRGRANNSAVFLRHRASKEFFKEFWNKVRLSGAGEPGIYFSNDPNWGANPCCEIALRAFQFCNLTEINAGLTFSQEDLDQAARVAAFFGTLQAGFTDLHYLRPVWRATTEKDALIGVGMTGICNGDVLQLNLKQAAQAVVEENRRVAALIGINPAARCTTVKPSGTTSCVVGTSSGIHAWHSKFYIRNMQCAVGDDLHTFFSIYHPGLVKIMDWDPKSAVIGIPQKASDKAILREDESAIDLLNRVKMFYEQWVLPGHVSGHNTNNVSATISIREHEWDEVGEWMWENRRAYNGLACLPFDGGTYADAPFQEITEEQYNEKMKLLQEPIDLTKIVEETDNTDLQAELACAGGACEIK
jgi:ribonucleoside-diphosphate reductase alpha chain